MGAHVANNRSQQELGAALQSDRQHILNCLDDLLRRSQLLAEAFEKKDNRRALPLAPSTNVSCEYSVGDVVLEPQEDAFLGSGTVGKVLRGRLGRQVRRHGLAFSEKTKDAFFQVVAVKQLHPEFSQHLSQNCNHKVSLGSRFVNFLTQGTSF